ncbi:MULTISPECIES: protein-export chaperone SecB [Nitrosomonas]|uniref:Protein-export protein SecB n=2 Tax=Nitrosomonas eutropha TaxID=916 RepID=SECB_NITEC|nr:MULTISPECIES: protein-export chaperone SecB [Nitrosomonas]Q0AIA2.1 RecName: Full=Protein-export protein SecB [Nitrosomonas eutropha C91]ABI58930.1 protein translocase subunit secB [Nitrosomonas eutropha C91]MXS79816.1 protein-export chaperone SecB [Nitrosomonas sp. GH22]PXV77277.1 protein translocase subunit secB [Nitrosomonas eutropha]SCX05250.1 protein translocase subunit secB [Nitrosomonas eutropha]SDW47921.1 protein translocase subunit secB [Nitrosomonas eutropha]
MTEPQQQPVFVIEKVYVKDLSLEIPHAPQVFLERESPEINLQLATSDNVIEGEIHEVIVTATVTARLKEKDKVMFLVEAHQAGIFRIRNVPGNEIEPVLGVLCPNILFPYLRETISDTVTRAGFPPVILNPVNFEAIYQQKQQEAAVSQPDQPVDNTTRH